MRFNIFLLILLPILCLATDWYILDNIKKRLKKTCWRLIHCGVSILFYIMLIVAVVNSMVNESDTGLLVSMWLLFIFISVYLPKFIYVLFDLASRIPELRHKKRIKWLSITGLSLGGLLFILMWWGALFNRYNLEVKEVTIEIENLPDSFDGYKIVQISDLHVGAYLNDTTFVSEIVDKINSLDADVILFTGDIVIRHADELKPFIKPLSRLKARDGAFAVLGNHDYGKYYPGYSTDRERENDTKLLRSMYKRLYPAIVLLDDDHRYIFRNDGNDSIAIIGVGNIGKPPFPAYGSLEKAYPEINDSVIKILMSHDPSHWQDGIMNNPEANIALTLSGHTHAMQMKLGPISPAPLYHNLWAGKYNDDLGHQLYINIGTGTVGFPARIGANPEITLITLKKK